MIIETRVNAKIIERENQKFPAFTAKINGRWFKIKFTQECEKSPKQRGVYKIKFDTLNSSIQRGKKYVNSKGVEGISNDTIWIKKIEEIVKYTDEELAKMNADEVENAIGGFTSINSDEPLPF